jgi:hypothetical protein
MTDSVDVLALPPAPARLPAPPSPSPLPIDFSDDSNGETTRSRKSSKALNNLGNVKQVLGHLDRFQRILSKGPSDRPLPPLLADQLNIMHDMEIRMDEVLHDINKRLNLLTEEPVPFVDNMIHSVVDSDEHWYLSCDITCIVDSSDDIPTH